MLAEIEKVAAETGGLVKRYEFNPEKNELNFCIMPRSAMEREVEKAGAREQRIGDKIYIPSIEVGRCEIDGEIFGELQLRDVPAILVDTKGGRTFSFENILFQHCVDANESGKAFEETPLGKYIGGHFAEALKKTFGDSLKEVSLLSKDNVFNQESDAYMPYFRDEAHRIKSFENETWWWWLKTPYASNATDFCSVLSHGDSHSNNASHAGGGVAPAFRIA